MIEYINKEVARRIIDSGRTREQMLAMLSNAVPADVRENKRGKWVNGMCNQCGEHAPFWAMASTYYQSNFCPNCGADCRGDGYE